MKRFIILTAFLCIGLAPLSPKLSLAAGKENFSALEKKLSKGLELSDLVNFVYLSNPSITVSRKSWQISIENYRIGKSYPDPRLTTTYFPSPIETRLGPQDWNVSLSQTFPFPGTLDQKGKVLEADARIARLKLDRTVKRVIVEVSTSYYELAYIARAVAIAKANLALNRELMKISENGYAGDRGLFYDVSKARAQSAQIQYDLMLLRELEQTEKAKLNTLLNRDPHAKLGRAGGIDIRETAYTLDEIYDLAMEHQEDILMADETVEKSREAIRLTRLETLPSFKLGLFYAGIGEPDVTNPPGDAGDDALGIQLGLNIPLWLGKNRSRAAKARAARDKARAGKTATANRTKAKISRLWFKLQNSKRLITLYENELIPQALTSIQTAESWFRDGRGSFADFLEVQATAYNFQLSLERARADYGETLVRLEQLAGVTLDKKSPGVKGGKNS